MTVEDRVLFPLLVCSCPGHCLEAGHWGEGAPAKLVLGPGHGYHHHGDHDISYQLPDHQTIHCAVAESHDGVSLLPVSAKIYRIIRLTSESINYE